MSTPTWFTDALAHAVRHADVTVDGARIAYRAWGKPGRQGVVLVHGGAAHAGWWDHIAPFLAAEHRVVAIDLSGHGDSDHRDDVLTGHLVRRGAGRRRAGVGRPGR